MTTGLLHEFGSRLSTMRTTEWEYSFNDRANPDVQPATGNVTSAVKKDLAYTSVGIRWHTDNTYRNPRPDFQLPHQIDGCDCQGQFDAQRRPLTVARSAVLKSISQTA